MASSSRDDIPDGTEEVGSSHVDRRSRVISLLNQDIIEYEQVAALMAQYVVPYVCKEPCRTSKQTGAKWVQEVLEGNDRVCRENFQVEKHIFHLLCSKLTEHGLRRSRYVGIEEMVAMFLYTVGHAQGNRIIQERFQYSGETVHRIFHRVLAACVNLSAEIIKPLDPEFRDCHPKILNARQYYPYFKDAIGAINGTHIKCVVNESKKDKYIDRNGYPTQNIMAVCDWDMCFTFVLAGWEGTAHDARIFQNAISTLAMNFPHPPEGKYYLVDAGYPTPIGYLGPYRRQRYHIPDFRRHQGYTTLNEMFNYYHSSLRTTIERTFGVWKNRFQLLGEVKSFSFETQVHIVCATMTIHNLIRRNSQTDVNFQQAETQNGFIEDHNDPVDVTSTSTIRRLSSTHMNDVRDRIKNQLVGSR